MKLTEQQLEIINTNENIKINAVAGSGKTSTMVEYAKTRPDNKKILYLAFNKSVKDEATKKFQNIENVRIETAHSLAFKKIVRKYDYKIANALKPYEIAKILDIKGTNNFEIICSTHVSKFVAYFCNSNALQVKDINYMDTLADEKAIEFAKKHYEYIETQTRKLLAKMNNGEIDITHDFYLKKYQLSNPVLEYDYILFDEGQDASPCMLDVFFKQKATKVIVGDTHQQIYGWRHAVNSLEKADYPNFYLSNSFRFNQSIADLANEILKMKKGKIDFKICGHGNNQSTKTRAVIARTNIGLLKGAIDSIKNVKDIYFEGNLSSYTYAQDGGSLFDILALYNEKRDKIKDSLIRGMKDLYDLEIYVKQTEDAQLSMMIEMVKEYGNGLYSILNSLKAKHTEREKAQIIFSTVHRSKGMEYDDVKLMEDFVTPDMINKENINEEEINMLYVAATRTKNTLTLWEDNLPEKFPKHKNIKTYTKFVEKKSSEIKGDVAKKVKGVVYVKPDVSGKDLFN
jgi:superfamily I DNA/RNA helicase